MKYIFRKAAPADFPQIWSIFQDAILRRKNEGSLQWQDGYPNPEVIRKDIEKNVGYVLANNDKIIAYCAILINDEPAYLKINGKWKTNGDFVVFHRMAVAKTHLGQGFARKLFHFIEEFAHSNQIYSIKADTNFDNLPMLALFEKSGYSYCGEVSFRNSPRKAFEKVLH